MATGSGIYKSSTTYQGGLGHAPRRLGGVPVVRTNYKPGLGQEPKRVGGTAGGSRKGRR